MGKNDVKNNPFAALENLKKTLPIGDIQTTSNNRRPRSFYDSLLENEASCGHNPNPFDFVLLKDRPTLFKIEEIESAQNLFSGYLDVTLKTLTPLHVMGYLEPEPDFEGHKIKKSHLYKQGNDFCIPGSSIKGMLRSFIETITNGFVSQAQEDPEGQPAYPKRPRKQHLAFDSFKPVAEVPEAIPPAYKLTVTDEIDIASYLFGYVEDKGNKHRVKIDDAIFPSSDNRYSSEEIISEYEMLDIYNAENAAHSNDPSPFMGGPHPSASNWWYMIPGKI